MPALEARIADFRAANAAVLGISAKTLHAKLRQYRFEDAGEARENVGHIGAD